MDEHKSGRKWPKVALLIILGVIIVAAAVIAGLLIGRHQTNKTTTSQATQKTQPSTTPTPATATVTPTPTLNKAIEAQKAANLFQKCQTNNINDQTDWQDSGASVIYRDFTSDNIEDVLVYAKIPGTMGYSRGCVYTIDSGNLKLLWRLQDSDFLPQSDFSVNASSQIVYSGKQTTSGGITDTFVLYAWSAPTKTFVALD